MQPSRNALVRGLLEKTMQRKAKLLGALLALLRHKFIFTLFEFVQFLLDLQPMPLSFGA
jgi:hypothetical protein